MALIKKQFNLHYYSNPRYSSCIIFLFIVFTIVAWRFVTNVAEEGHCGYLNKCTPFIDMDSVNITLPDDDASGHCFMLKLPVMPASLKEVWKPTPMVETCKHILPVIQHGTTTKDKASRILPSVQEKCCVQEVIRGVNDNDYSLSKCEELEGGDELPPTMESMLVTCSNGKDMNAEANVPLKDSVKDKLTHWDKVGADEKPYSVFLFGFDSTSRMHFHRSLPRSLEVMRELGFVEFQNYQSAMPSTLTNFMAFLMGLPRPVVRSTCAPSWKSPWDDCPLIWKDFAAANYVTAYLEDGSQTFNFYRQAGFVQQPTDYYLHHLFMAVKEYRTSWMNQILKDYQECFSTERPADFLLRYSERFLNVFRSSPFFMFTWWANPFHDDFYALADFDRKLSGFFQRIQQSKDVEENVLFILLSDHGDRYNFFSGHSMESFLERALPPLFIRLPRRLVRKSPELLTILKSNLETFVTPFDVHHTLLHVLSLTDKAAGFRSVLSDRSSLLVPVPKNRTCAGTNVPVATCACNVGCSAAGCDLKSTHRVLERGTVEQALGFALMKLNEKVGRSKHADLCERWWAKPSHILYTQVIKDNGEDSFEIVFAFYAQPGNAAFEVRMRIVRGIGGGKIYAKVLGFARVNRYGDQSHCVQLVSDQDKELKTMCMCKGLRLENVAAKGFIGSHGLLSLFQF